MSRDGPDAQPAAQQEAVPAEDPAQLLAATEQMQPTLEAQEPPVAPVEVYNVSRDGPDAEPTAQPAEELQPRLDELPTQPVEPQLQQAAAVEPSAPQQPNQQEQEHHSASPPPAEEEQPAKNSTATVTHDTAVHKKSRDGPDAEPTAQQKEAAPIEDPAPESEFQTWAYQNLLLLLLPVLYFWLANLGRKEHVDPVVVEQPVTGFITERVVALCVATITAGSSSVVGLFLVLVSYNPLNKKVAIDVVQLPLPLLQAIVARQDDGELKLGNLIPKITFTLKDSTVSKASIAPQ